jgi:hypothetical protein
MEQLDERTEQARKGREDEELLGINRQPVGIGEVTSVLGLAERAEITKVPFEELQLMHFKRLEEPGPSLEEAEQAATEFGGIVDRFLNRNHAPVDENGTRQATIETISDTGTTFRVHVTQAIGTSGQVDPTVSAVLKFSNSNSKYSTGWQEYFVDDHKLTSSMSTIKRREQPNSVAIEIKHTVSAFVDKDHARLVRNFLHDPKTES